jgi:folate-binding protein YgfZ
MPQSSRGRALRDLHVAHGAVFSDRDGVAVVTSHGDPAAEYSAVLDGAGVVDLSERGVLEVSGPKRTDLLQGLVSNDLVERQPGQGCRAALMTAKGRLRFLLRLLVDEGVVHVETQQGGLEALQRILEHYRVAAPVRFRPTSRVVLGLLGIQAPGVLRSLGIDPPPSPEDHIRTALAGRDIRVARAGDLPGGGFALHLEPGDAGAVWRGLAEAGARPVGRQALDARRVEDLHPWYGWDITEDNLLHETGLLGDLHSPTKGCYLGQEVVARLEARGGNVNKALRRLRLSAPSGPDQPVQAGGRDVGRLATVAVSPRFGPLALAWIHRDHFVPGTSLEVAGEAATVVANLEEE